MEEPEDLQNCGDGSAPLCLAINRYCRAIIGFLGRRKSITI